MEKVNDKIYSIDEIKSIVAPIAAKYGVERVSLFGSYARGEQNGASDIDFLIDKGRLRGLEFASMLGDLMENFEKEIDLVTSVAMIEKDGSANFNLNVEREKVIIYE